MRIVRFILVALLSLGMLASLATAQPRKCDDTAANKSCCAKHQDSQQVPRQSDDDASRPTCVMVCCQALHVVPSNSVALDVSDDAQSTQPVARPALHSVVEINSIFHPPRV